MTDEKIEEVLPQTPPPNQPGVRPGAILYFREAKVNPRGKKETAMRFKGHGFGVFLGHVPQLAPSPPKDFVVYMMSNIGYIGTDDITEMLGRAAVDELVTKMHEKYSKLLNFPPPPKVSSLVTPGGAPLSLPPSPPLEEPECDPENDPDQIPPVG